MKDIRTRLPSVSRFYFVRIFYHNLHKHAKQPYKRQYSGTLKRYTYIKYKTNTKMRKRLLTTALTALALACPAGAETTTPYNGSRIFWDMSSRTTVFANGGYARMIQLQDGRLMAVCENGGINTAFSDDMGKTWGRPRKIVANTNNTPNCVPDLIQMRDGTIIVAYNPRPKEPFTTDRKFGIRCKRSSDNGRTWSGEIFVNDASHTFNDGCWEPSMLELPSGELQLYFADEGPYTGSDEQQISMCRSFDGGQTWGNAEKISFRAGHRDGMPVPVLLNDDKTIVVAIEDNGWPGYNDFFPTTVRCGLTTNWHGYFVGADSDNRDKTLDLNYCQPAKGGAPYIRVLPWGETVLSWQSTYNHGSTNTMYTAVGDKDARNFKAMSMPFVTSDQEAVLWNSLAVVDTGYVVAVGGVNGKIEMINGYPTRMLQAPCARPTVDGLVTPGEGYMRQEGNQIMLGTKIGASVTADFAYDNEHLYFIARVDDNTVMADGTKADGVRLLVDADNLSSGDISQGMYCFFMRRDGKCQAWRGADGRWNSDESMSFEMKAGSDDSRYTVEAAIPWSLLGKDKPPTGQRMAATIEVVDARSNTTITEGIPDTRRNASSTYMEFRLKDGGTTDGITNATDGGYSPDITVDKGKVTVESKLAMNEIAICSANGRTLRRVMGPGKRFTTHMAHDGVAIVKTTLADGSSTTRKIIIQQ